jgi:hypothetical protein
MSSRPLILASVLLFVNGCDYSQKKPQVVFGALGAATERVVCSLRPPVANLPVLRTSQSDVIKGSVV